jgi:hypothetical protein
MRERTERTLAAEAYHVSQEPYGNALQVFQLGLGRLRAGLDRRYGEMCRLDSLTEAAEAGRWPTEADRRHWGSGGYVTL